jgi:hypothetical protein
MTNSKKLGLALLPLIPLTAIGVVEVANHVLAPEPATVHVLEAKAAPVKPAPTKPVTPPPGPKPTPQPVQPPQPPPSR